MPVDANGNRADAIIYGGSTIKRMNIGRLYEHFTKAAMRDLTHRLRKEAGFQPHIPPTDFQLEQLKATGQWELIDGMFATLLKFYQVLAPIQYDLLVDDPNHFRHVSAVLRDGVVLYIPPDNPVNNLEAVKEIMESEFCPHYGPVTYRDNNNQLVTTVKPMLIGSLYMMMLEKTGEDWSSVASVKVNHFGVPAKLNNFDKNTTPGRQAPVRGLGEAETRSTCSVIGPEATMELLDQSNNPETHKHVIESIVKAQNPMNIDRLVDRNKVPFGGSRPVSFVNHFLACRGIKLVYRQDTPDGGGQ